MVKAKRPARRVRASKTQAMRDMNAALLVSSVRQHELTELAQSTATALRESEAYVRLLLESAAEGFHAIDRDGATTHCNAAFLRMLGFADEAEVIGVKLHDLIHHSHADGRPYPNAECPMYLAALTGSSAHVDNELFFRRDGSSFPVEYWVRPILRDGELNGAVCTFMDITSRKHAEAERELLANELNHRVKNTLAMVQAIASQSFRGDKADPDARRAFEARLQALATAHDVLTRENWDKASLHEVVTVAIGPHRALPGGTARFQIDGPELGLKPWMALNLSLTLHELATNAAKYGALSGEVGKVTITWTLVRGPDEERLRLRWDESGGPPVAPPQRRGFGTRLIQQGLSGGGDVQLLFEPTGVTCEIDVPLAR